ncbi:ABC transporter ATP-binding protein [Archaeoglobales archaeon ex4484_92]|nr:MAG: ABC transporter ATP-binding protein [Archaeoglobales archaeon ex4484_92]HDN74510.1 ABC transporter ATP-binding protein [Archaeoglobus sp.]
MKMSVILETKEVTKNFSGFIAVNKVSLSFERRSITALIGPNGAGKTTFVNLCTGMFRPDRGKIIFDGKDVTGLPPERRVRLGMSRTFQIVNIFPGLTVEQNIKIPLLSRSKEVKKEIDHFIDLFNFSQKRSVPASELSHGDQKILEIAMAISTRPKMIFLDEPMAGVNPAERTRILDLIRELRDREKLTIVIVEHDMDVVFRIAERIVVMNRGKIIADGTPDEIRANEVVKEVYLKGVEV